jgi:hypothetical protein
MKSSVSKVPFVNSLYNKELAIYMRWPWSYAPCLLTKCRKRFISLKKGYKDGIF